jgi:response regulator NasT
LKVLVANQDRTRLETLADAAIALDNEVVSREVDVADVAAAARAARPDVAIVGLHNNAEHALGLIAEIVRERRCPVVVVIDDDDPEFVRSAAQLGAFAYTTSVKPAALESTIQVAIQRFDQAAALEGALGRRAVIERAKGVLMERYSIGDEAAFEMLRDHARRSSAKVLDVSDALLRSHTLLSGEVKTG